MISIQNTSLSALRALATRVQSNSDNIANVGTNGFKKTRVTLAATEPSGVTAEVVKTETPGAEVYQQADSGLERVELSNVELSSELPKLSINSTLYKANLKALQTADEMLGSLLKLKG